MIFIVSAAVDKDRSYEPACIRTDAKYGNSVINDAVAEDVFCLISDAFRGSKNDHHVFTVFAGNYLLCFALLIAYLLGYRDTESRRFYRHVIPADILRHYHVRVLPQFLEFRGESADPVNSKIDRIEELYLLIDRGLSLKRVFASDRCVEYHCYRDNKDTGQDHEHNKTGLIPAHGITLPRRKALRLLSPVRQTLL